MIPTFTPHGCVFPLPVVFEPVTPEPVCTRAETPYANAWTALRMVRDALEELGPVGCLISEDAVLRLYGPVPVHEARALVEGIQRFIEPGLAR